MAAYVKVAAIQRLSSAAGDIPAGKMQVAYGVNQTGGYHYFLAAVAREWQRHVKLHSIAMPALSRPSLFRRERINVAP